MNPFFELRWPDAHTRLITYIADALQQGLPADLLAGTEEQVVTIDDPEPPAVFRPDILVHEPWANNDAGGVAVAPPVDAPVAIATEPLRILVESETERRVTIHDVQGRLVTVLEVLSPSNKEEGPSQARYLAKRGRLIGAGVNVVEIDLVRQGRPVFHRDVLKSLVGRRFTYGVCVWRATQADQFEFYPVGLRERLPVISVPLRPRDADVVLELQPLINQCHARGRYHLLNYRTDALPPFAAEEAGWVDEVLRSSQLR